MIAGAELHEHPYDPITPASTGPAAELGDDLPVAWVHRSDRYAEKLATPDTSVGDLIGDVDPIKVAEGRTLGDPETIHYGLVPRMHRGIFAVNELPDLAERIQVGLLNVLEERDIQVRGYVLRLPLDLLLVASANPEDYTNRGRIITPLKDRFGAEIRTHYPLDLDRRGRAGPPGGGAGRRGARAPARGARPLHPRRPRLALRRRPLRASRPGSPSPAPRRSRPLRCAGPRSRRAGRGPPVVPVARIGDAETITATLRGKVEFEADGEGREMEILDHLLRRATAETWRARLGGLDLSGLVAVGGGRGRRPGRGRGRAQPSCSASSSGCPGWPRCWPGSAWRRCRPRPRPPAPSSSPWRACT